MAGKKILKSWLLFCAALSVAPATQGESQNNIAATSFASYEWAEEALNKVIRTDHSWAPVTSCKKLNNMFAADGLTNLQKEREWKKYDNRIIPLTGIVVDVSELPLDKGYHAVFKCVSSNSFVSDFTVRIPKHQAQYAYDLNVGEKRNVALQLRSYGKLTGIYGEMPSLKFTRTSADICKPTLKDASRKDELLRYECDATPIKVKTKQKKAGSGTIKIAEIEVKRDDSFYGFFQIEGLEKYNTYIKIATDGSGKGKVYAPNLKPCVANIQADSINLFMTEKAEQIKQVMRENGSLKNIREFIQQFIEDKKEPPALLTCEQEVVAAAQALGTAYIALWEM